MGFIVADAVQETTTTTGTGAFTLGGATSGNRTFSSVMANGSTTHYRADDGAGNVEIGLGTWNTGNTLSRTTVLYSTNSNSLVSFASGSKTLSLVWCVETFALLFAGTNLAGLPAANPGGGQPWLNGGVMQVGA